MATMTTDATIDLPQQLLSPRVYVEKTRSVELIETHISWVFLTDQFVYKLKKPVRFDFLDFSTAELRREACENEVKLNRRLAPGVYLGVVPIVIKSNGQFAVGCDGLPIDWLVKMKRLPAAAALDVMIHNDSVDEANVQQLAKMLAEFYKDLPPVTVTVDDYRRSIEQHVRANREELGAGVHHLNRAKIQRMHAAQLFVLKLAPDLLDDRVRNGRIVEGHGDLRPEHIYFNPSPVIIDCIEFNREFRTLDVFDELAFLSMECDALGASGITDVVVGRYAEQSGDRPPQQLFDFYRLYRACVRAKVCSLRAEQLRGELRSKWLTSANKYLDLADRYRRTLGPPVLILVRGLPGTGKSTIAQTISEELGIELLQTDELRREMFGPPRDRVGFNEGRYRAESRSRVYDEMHRRAGELLKSETSVMLDATYLTAELRTAAARTATENDAQFLAVTCRCPDEVALQRITAREQEGGSTSETRPEFFHEQRQMEEPDPPDFDTTLADTSDGIAEPIKHIFEALRTLIWSESCTP